VWTIERLNGQSLSKVPHDLLVVLRVVELLKELRFKLGGLRKVAQGCSNSVLLATDSALLALNLQSWQLEV
jgi:hypothetical protein